VKPGSIVDGSLAPTGVVRSEILANDAAEEHQQAPSPGDQGHWRDDPEVRFDDA
jgi:hypothetical protein